MSMPRRGRLSAVRIVLTATLVASVVKVCLFDLVIVKGDSMVPAIAPGTIALVARCAYGLRIPISGAYLLRWKTPLPGDIVLVEGAAGKARRSVKRVFETGPAFIKAEAGMLSGSGDAVPMAASDSLRVAGSSFVPRGRVFIVGDNAAVSYDSRDYGPVPIEKIAGKVILFTGGPSRMNGISESSRDGLVDDDR
jgi:signal peptidase I